MSGGQQDTVRASNAWDACEDAQDALDQLFGKTDAYDRAFGPHPQIVKELQVTLKKYGLKLEKLK